MQANSQEDINSNTAGVVRWGGLSLLGAAILLFAFIAIVVTTGQELPLPPQQVLIDSSAATNLFATAVVGEFLLLPGAVALYFALRPFAPARSALGAVIMGLSVPLFLVSRGLILSMPALSAAYLAAEDETLRTALFANAVFAIELQNTYATSGVLLLSLGSILLGWAMLASNFANRFGYVAILAGVLSIFAPFAVMAGMTPLVAMLGLVLGGVWQAWIGYRLFVIGGKS